MLGYRDAKSFVEKQMRTQSKAPSLDDYTYDVPEYLQDIIDRTGQGTYGAAKKTAATLPTSMKIQSGMRQAKTNLAATGTTGGFSERMVSEMETEGGLTMQSLLADQEASIEQERLGALSTVNQLEMQWKTAQRSADMQQMQLDEQRRQFDKQQEYAWLDFLL